ncbi:hypothetical protein GJD93_01620 [Acinetobacter towneri]|uniref:Uncharacterized protein n=1 Tax=Acinetobacter towneri TaxID=202956 RepID=A0AAP9GSZ9_9GAMM|nr:hypothetical protein GJD93_01620 [Acinetobacter towneri]
MLFSVFYVGDSCQGWGREFESRFPLQIQKNPHRKMGAFLLILYYVIPNHTFFIIFYFTVSGPKYDIFVGSCKK